MLGHPSWKRFSARPDRDVQGWRLKARKVRVAVFASASLGRIAAIMCSFWSTAGCNDIVPRAKGRYPPGLAGRNVPSGRSPKHVLATSKGGLHDRVPIGSMIRWHFAQYDLEILSRAKEGQPERIAVARKRMSRALDHLLGERVRDFCAQPPKPVIE